MAYRALPSPSVKVGGIVYFARMLEKIRAHARGDLPSEYQANLGKGFDGLCAKFLNLDYDKVVERVKAGGTDDQILEWCFTNGRRPSKDEIYVWNEFMRKCGWNDKLTEKLIFRKQEAGMTERDDIQTMFDFIDADEGRSVSSGQMQVTSVANS
jgi:hypothetical protein